MIVDIYESQPEIATVGAGINLWSRTRELLELVGLSRFKNSDDELKIELAQGRGFVFVFLIFRTQHRRGYE